MTNVIDATHRFNRMKPADTSIQVIGQPYYASYEKGLGDLANFTAKREHLLDQLLSEDSFFALQARLTT